MEQALVRETNLTEYERLATGKVRDLYRVDDNLLMIATDRLSAFDVVFPGGIPGKGAILNQMAAFWFEKTRHLIPNHIVSTTLSEMPAPLQAHPELEGRVALCKRAEVLPVECIVRGYLEGSGLKEYKATGQIKGIELPPGLERRSQLPEPIFTPSTKAEQGLHDENISYERCVEIVGPEMAEKLRTASLAVYRFAHDMLDPLGITLADTKFEFGLIDGELVLVDEILTPDSSRYWVKGGVDEKGAPISYDKQYVRDYLETLDWDKTPPAPALPEEVIANTLARYREIFSKITGKEI